MECRSLSSSPTASQPSAKPIPEKILKNIAGKNTGNTRIFTFGVGDDVNATMLDQMADQSRAVSTYVRPEEDIEAKVSGLYSKISHPVLANLKLTAGSNVTFSEIYPPELPDLFHGQQLMVLGRYIGQRPGSHQADRHRRQGRQGIRLRDDLPRQDGRKQGLCRAPVGTAQGRLHARSNPGQRREKGIGGRGRGLGEEIRHHNALHELPDRAGWACPGGARPATATAVPAPFRGAASPAVLAPAKRTAATSPMPVADGRARKACLAS